MINDTNYFQFRNLILLTILLRNVILNIVDSVTSWWKGDTNSSKPSFCNSLDCPRFKVIESTDVSLT